MRRFEYPTIEIFPPPLQGLSDSLSDGSPPSDMAGEV